MVEALTIAIVDDDEAILSGLSSLIRSVGYKVRLFETAEALLEDTRSPIGCVVTDIQLSGMNGLELQREISLRFPTIPVIVMTGFPEDAMREKAMSAGASSFLTKPFEAETILQAISIATRTALKW